METWRGSYQYSNGGSIDGEMMAKDILGRQIQETLFDLVSKNTDGFVVISPLSYWHEPVFSWDGLKDYTINKLFVEMKIGHSHSVPIYAPEYKFLYSPSVLPGKLNFKQRIKILLTGRL